MATEDEQAVSYLKKLMLFMAIVLLVVLAFTISVYQHEPPAQDCSKPYDYPICARAYVPQAFPPVQFGTFVFTAIIMTLVAVLLIRTSYRASVVEQKEIIAATSHMTKGIIPPTVKPERGIDLKNIK